MTKRHFIRLAAILQDTARSTDVGVRPEQHWDGLGALSPSRCPALRDRTACRVGGKGKERPMKCTKKQQAIRKSFLVLGFTPIVGADNRHKGGDYQEFFRSPGGQTICLRFLGNKTLY